MLVRMDYYVPLREDDSIANAIDVAEQLNCVNKIDHVFPDDVAFPEYYLGPQVSHVKNHRRQLFLSFPRVAYV